MLRGLFAGGGRKPATQASSPSSVQDRKDSGPSGGGAGSARCASDGPLPIDARQVRALTPKQARTLDAFRRTDDAKHAFLVDPAARRQLLAMYQPGTDFKNGIANLRQTVKVAVEADKKSAAASDQTAYQAARGHMDNFFKAHVVHSLASPRERAAARLCGRDSLYAAYDNRLSPYCAAKMAYIREHCKKVNFSDLHERFVEKVDKLIQDSPGVDLVGMTDIRRDHRLLNTALGEVLEEVLKQHAPSELGPNPNATFDGYFLASFGDLEEFATPLKPKAPSSMQTQASAAHNGAPIKSLKQTLAEALEVVPGWIGRPGSYEQFDTARLLEEAVQLEARRTTVEGVAKSKFHELLDRAQQAKDAKSAPSAVPHDADARWVKALVPLIETGRLNQPEDIDAFEDGLARIYGPAVVSKLPYAAHGAPSPDRPKGAISEKEFDAAFTNMVGRWMSRDVPGDKSQAAVTALAAQYFSDHPRPPDGDDLPPDAAADSAHVAADGTLAASSPGPAGATEGEDGFLEEMPVPLERPPQPPGQDPTPSS